MATVERYGKRKSMTLTVSIEEASSHLPELLSRLHSDAEEIVISQDGAPVARLLPARIENAQAAAPRIPGEDRGRFCVPREFFDPLPDDVLADFYDGTVAP